MDAVMIVGAGGHARVAIDVLQAMGFDVSGCLSRDGLADASLPVPVLGRETELEARIVDGHATVFVGVGDNRTRIDLARRVQGAGGFLVTAVSPHAIVSRSVVIGSGSLVMPGAVVNAGTMLGQVVIVNTNASVDHDCRVGAGAHVAPGAAVAGGVTIGEGVLLGIGCCVVPGVTIGDLAVVGAGAAVVRDVPPGVTVVGVPARPPGQR